MVVDGEGFSPLDQPNAPHGASPGFTNPTYIPPRSTTPESESSDLSEETTHKVFTPSSHTLQPFCNTDKAINDTLDVLHQRLKHGDRTTQRTIDRYLFICACDQHLSGNNLRNLLLPESDVPQYSTLPDITRFIQHSFTTSQAPGIIVYYMQLLSPLKRKSRTRRGTPAVASCPVEASICLNLIQATLLGLYPRSSKQPLWQTRVAIVGCIYKLHTSAFQTQCKFLTASHDLLRLCFTEYLLNVRADFCPVENSFLTQQAGFLVQYDAACITVCDYVRQTCVQSTVWGWEHINSVSLTSLDRISRMCRTRVIPPITYTQTNNIDTTQLQKALTEHVVYTESSASTCVTQRDAIHQTLRTHMLPWNMMIAQAERTVANFTDSLFPILSVCEKHVCVRCVLAVNNRVIQRISKLRMDTQTKRLTCANCNASDTVIQINMFGKLLCIRSQSYFCCQECTSLHLYDPERPLMCTHNAAAVLLPLFQSSSTPLALAMKTPALKQTAEYTLIHGNPNGNPTCTNVPRDRKHRCKWCGRICSARMIVLLHTDSSSMLSMTLCFKHIPPPHMIPMIKDTNALIRYIMNHSLEKK